MKDYSLLLNKTYLYRLKHPHEKMVFSKVAQETGLTRQTVAKEYKEFEDLENLNFMGIEDLHEDETNKFKRACLIIKDIDKDCNRYTINDLADMLGIARSTLSPYGKLLRDEEEKEILDAGVYAIVYNNNIIYIGSTDCFKQRKKQHLYGIKNKHKGVYLYEYCAKNNIKDVNIVFLCKVNNKEERLQMERELITSLKPVCNVMFI